MNQFWGENECEILTHSQQITDSKNSQKGVNSQVDYQNHNALGPQRSLLYRVKDSIEVKCKTHTQQSTSSSESLRPFNLTENAPRHFQRLLAWLL